MVDGKKRTVRKIIRDAPIPKAQILRLANKAGVESIGGLCYAETRANVKSMVHELLKDAYIFMKAAGRKQLSATDVVNAIYNRYGVRAVYSKTSLAALRAVKGVSTKKTGGEGSTRRWRSGTVAKRNVKHRQKEYNTVYIPITTFNRVVNEQYQLVSAELNYAMQVNARSVLQLFVESRVIKTFAYAGSIAKTAGHSRVLVKDIRLSVGCDAL